MNDPQYDHEKKPLHLKQIKASEVSCIYRQKTADCGYWYYVFGGKNSAPYLCKLYWNTQSRLQKRYFANLGQTKCLFDNFLEHCSCVLIRV